jgi:NAD(P)-dependent dehydrogenase (short-subunit alcohol dehydrogenase family)
MEAICRAFSAESAGYGIRAACLRSTGLPETRTIEIIFGIHAKVLGIKREEFQHPMESMSHTRRSTTLKELTNTAVFLASDLSTGMTGTVANLRQERSAIKRLPSYSRLNKICNVTVQLLDSRQGSRDCTYPFHCRFRIRR